MLRPNGDGERERESLLSTKLSSKPSSAQAPHLVATVAVLPGRVLVEFDMVKSGPSQGGMIGKRTATRKNPESGNGLFSGDFP